MKNPIIYFFAPSVKTVALRIILAFVLLFIVSFFVSILFDMMDYTRFGWPLTFDEGGYKVPGKSNIYALIIDIIFWYTLMCFIPFMKNILTNKSAK